MQFEEVVLLDLRTNPDGCPPPDTDRLVVVADGPGSGDLSGTCVAARRVVVVVDDVRPVTRPENAVVVLTRRSVDDLVEDLLVPGVFDGVVDVVADLPACTARLDEPDDVRLEPSVAPILPADAGSRLEAVVRDGTRHQRVFVSGGAVDVARDRVDAAADRVDDLARQVRSLRRVVAPRGPTARIGPACAELDAAVAFLGATLTEITGMVDRRLRFGSPSGSEISAAGVVEPESGRRTELVAAVRQCVDAWVDGRTRLDGVGAELRSLTATAWPPGVTAVDSTGGRTVTVLPEFARQPLSPALIGMAFLSCLLPVLLLGSSGTLPAVAITVGWSAMAGLLRARRPVADGTAGWSTGLATAALFAVAAAGGGVVGALLGASPVSGAGRLLAGTAMVVGVVGVLMLSAVVCWRRATTTWQAGWSTGPAREGVASLTDATADAIRAELPVAERRDSVASAVAEMAACLDEIAAVVRVTGVPAGAALSPLLDDAGDHAIRGVRMDPHWYGRRFAELGGTAEAFAVGRLMPVIL